MPPKMVAGIDRRRPIIAAVIAELMRRMVSDVASVEPCTCAIKIPAMAAMDPPIAQERAAIRSGMPPLRRTRSGLSTTARIAMPRRARLKRKLSATPSNAAVVIAKAWKNWK